MADGFARALAGFSSDEEFLRAFETVPNAHIPELNLFFALRNRFAEDELAKAVKQGTTQYDGGRGPAMHERWFACPAFPPEGSHEQ